VKGSTPKPREGGTNGKLSPLRTAGDSCPSYGSPTSLASDGGLAPGRFGSLTRHGRGLPRGEERFQDDSFFVETKKEPIFSTGKCESALSTLSIPLYQNDQKGRRACFLFPCL